MNSPLPAEHDEQRIRETAYHLWEKDGRPSGQAERYWEMAQNIAEDSAREPPAPAAKSDRVAKGKKAKPAKSKKSS